MRLRRSAMMTRADAADPAFQERVDGDAEATQFFERIQLFAFNDETDRDDHAAGCTRSRPSTRLAPRRRPAITCM